MNSVLLVHPDAKILEAADSILEQSGHAATTAADGAGALDTFQFGPPDIVSSASPPVSLPSTTTSDAPALLKKARPHLLLLDIAMPGKNGVETLKRIRELDDRVGVMMITADAAIETMERCRAHGAYDYISTSISAVRHSESTPKFC